MQYRAYRSDTRKGYSTGHTGQTQRRGTVQAILVRQKEGVKAILVRHKEGVKAILVRHKEGVQYRPYWSDTRKGYSTGHTGQTQGRDTVQAILVRHKEGVQYRPY